MLNACRLRFALLASVLLVSTAMAQDEEPPAPSLSQRLSQFGRNLFGRNNASRPQADQELTAGSSSSNFSPGALRSRQRGAVQLPASQPPRVQTPPQAQRSSRRTAQPGFERMSPPVASESIPHVAQAPPPVTVSDAPAAGKSTAPSATPPAETAGASPAASDATDTTPSQLPTVIEGQSPDSTLRQRLNEARAYAPPTSAGRERQVTAPAATPNPSEPRRETNSRRSEISSAAPLTEKTASPATSTVENQSAGQTGVLLDAQSPAISIETSGPQKIKIGIVAAFNVVLRNTGADAQDVVVSVKVPEGTDLVNTHPSEGTMRPGTASDGAPVVEWLIPTLRGGTKGELGIRLIPRKSRPLDLAVSCAYAPVGAVAKIEVQEPRLLMTLTGPEEVFYGERELYKLTLSNPGNGDAENVLVRLLPTTPGEDQAVTHQIGVLRAGENKVVELELTARQVGSLRLKAEATADNGLHAAVDEEVIVRRADLKIDIESPKLLYAGTAGNYRVRVRNPGNSVAKTIQIAAILPSGAKFVSCTEGGTYNQEQGRILWTTTNLRPNAEWTCSFRCELEHPGSNGFQVVGSAEGDLRQIASANTEVEALADLTLTVKDPTGPVPVGQDANYEVHITNRGSKSADGVEVLAFFSPGIEPTKVEGGPYEIGPGQIAMKPIASLGPGEELTFTIKARAHRSGNHIFRAEVTCPALETKLAAEETTRFYGEASASDESNSQPEAQAAPTDGSEPAPAQAPVESLTPPPAAP